MLAIKVYQESRWLPTCWVLATLKLRTQANGIKYRNRSHTQKWAICSLRSSAKCQQGWQAEQRAAKLNESLWMLRLDCLSQLSLLCKLKLSVANPFHQQARQLASSDVIDVHESQFNQATRTSEA